MLQREGPESIDGKDNSEDSIGLDLMYFTPRHLVGHSGYSVTSTPIQSQASFPGSSI